MPKEYDGPIIEDITDLDDDEPKIEELEDDADGASSGAMTSAGTSQWQPKDYRNPAKPLTDLTRDGVPLTEELIRRKAEHNEGMLSTLEEIALHQLDIDKIEVIGNCRCLKILYLQSNLIRKIENLHKLKQLDYLNLALNNIERIENLERCEALKKLDLTVNFIDLDELHTVGSLKSNTCLTDLFLTGNPCVAHWESGYRDYVVATLPQLESLDGTEITRAERIKALQRLPELERELKLLAPLAAQRKVELAERRKERRRKIETGELVETTETTDEWCPDVRIADARELREIELEKEETRKNAQRDSLFGAQPKRERRFFKEDGTPIQMNTAKWPFAIEEDALNVYVDIALPKFLDSNMVDADVQPTYVRVQAGQAIKEGRDKNTIQLLLPAEVLVDSSTAKRSSTTGHLLLTCPKLHPVVTSKAPQKKKAAERLAAPTAKSAGLLPAPGPAAASPGANLKAMAPGEHVRSIVSNGKRGNSEPAPALKPSLGPDFDDEDEVPPLL